MTIKVGFSNTITWKVQEMSKSLRYECCTDIVTEHRRHNGSPELKRMEGGGRGHAVAKYSVMPSCRKKVY